MEFLIFIICLVFICFGVFVVLNFRNRKYTKFILENSVALKNLIDVNNKYLFYNNKTKYDESYAYDNEIYFDSISCEDYLIYQLQFKKNNIIKEIKNIDNNNQMYAKYCQDIAEINNFGKYTQEIQKLNERYLLKIEKEIFNKYIKRPQLKFYIHVCLYCSRINGHIYQKKDRYFSSKEILDLINRLNNRSNGFYNDKEIWYSLCRVERGRVSNKMRFSIYQRDGYRCCICGRGQKNNLLEIDHIKPIAKGGKSTYDNLQTLCQRCNQNKGDKY